MYKYFLFLLLLNFSYSQSFVASTSKKVVGLDEQFEVSFRFSGSDIDGLSSFKTPDFSNFYVVFGPNKESSIEIINGKTSASLKMTYLIKPKKTGTFTISKAYINYRGRTFSSNPLGIKVVQGTVKNNVKNEPVKQNNGIAGNLFIKAIADKNKVYKGEPVIITYKLYYRVEISSQIEVKKLPVYEGFWIEDISNPGLDQSVENVNGKIYNTAVLKKVVLYPNRSGVLSVTPLELNLQIAVEVDDPNVNPDYYKNPFFRQFMKKREIVDYTASSNRLSVNVIDLPNNNVPASFNGAVGKFNVELQPLPNKIKQHEPFSIKLKISGQGNIKFINPPDLQLPTGLKKYETVVNDNLDPNNKLAGVKEIEYPIISDISGEKVIPSIKFSYFDPYSKKYVERETKPIKLNIIENNSIDVDNEIQLDIKPIMTNLNEGKKASTFSLAILGLIIIIAVPAAFIVIVKKKRRDEILKSDKKLYKFTVAYKNADKRLKQIEKGYQKELTENLAAEISLILNDYLKAKLSYDNVEYNKENIISFLMTKDIDDKFLNEIKNLLEDIEIINYAPSLANNEMKLGIIKKTKDIIYKIEQKFIETNEQNNTK